VLLDGVAGAEVAWVEGLAAGKAFVLAMVKADAVLTEFPAEIDFLVIDDGGKIEQADIEVLDDATGFENAGERGLQGFGQLVVFGAHGCELFVRDDHAAHHHDARSDSVELVVQARELLAGVHGLNEKGLEFLAGALRFGQRKEALRRFRSFVVTLFVVFVWHCGSILGTAFATGKEDKLKSVLL